MRDKFIKLFSYLVPKLVSEFFADVYCLQVKEQRLSLIINNKLAYNKSLREPVRVAKTIEIDDKHIVVFSDGSRKEFIITDDGPKIAKKESIVLGKEPELVG